MTWCTSPLLLLQCVLATFATFPPVSNPPPIPNQGVRTVDISGQRFYVQDDLQINPPQTVVKEDIYLSPGPPDPKVDDDRWYVYENQSGESIDYPRSTETFDRYYSNGLPAVGPVATPVPDDSYIAQPSGISKVLPNGPPNIGSSDIWVLAKGPDDQYVPQRWVQLQIPQQRISQVVGTDINTPIVPGMVKSIQPTPLKPSAALTNILQQIWLRGQPQVLPQKSYQDAVPEVANLPITKQNVGYPPQPVKQYVQTDVVQDSQPLFPLPLNIASQKSSGFSLPPLLPPTYKETVINPNQKSVVVSQPDIYKGGDISPPDQTVLVNQPDNYKGVDMTYPNQPVLVSQPVNYKGVEVTSPNQPVIVDQPVNYKGVDSNLPNKAFLVNQPESYKGVEITSPKQPVIVNQPINYKGIAIPSPNPALLVNQQPNYKGVDIAPPDQAVLMNQPVAYKGGYVDPPKQVAVVTQSQINVPVPKNNVLTQVKHIWIPTSAQTGKFITVPVVGSMADSGKSAPSKGVAINAAAPISVSGTWVLRQDGPLPRFEPQRIFPSQAVQKGNPIASGTVIQFTSPKNAPMLGKSVDSKVPVDIWANNRDFRTPPLIGKSVASPFPAGKAGSVVSGKSGPVVNIAPQKSYISSDKGANLQPIPPLVASSVLQPLKGKPCLTGPQNPLISPKVVPYSVYRSSMAVNKQSLPRILRINRYPYGSYYVLNPRIGPSLYAYPRPQASVIQQSKNRLMQIAPTKQISIPSKQIFFSVPQRQVSLSGNQIKTLSPVMQPQFVFPPVQAANRVRYTYPQASYLRSLPAMGKNVFIFPSGKRTRPDALQSSSSESSSSESSSSESKSVEKKPKSKEEIGEAKSEASPESVEVKSERETEDVEAAASEPEPESKEVSASASEASESIEGTESEANSAS